MKRNLLLIFSIVSFSLFGQGDLIITAVFDGPLPGGLPKGVEIYAKADIADLSQYGIGSANNGGGTDGEEFTFSQMMVSAGTFMYVTSDSAAFVDFFGIQTNFNAGSAMGINGDDAVELFHNGAVIDIFGDIDVDGNGTTWEYLDGWAYRVNGTGGDGSTFVESNWTFSGVDALDGETSNAGAANPVPIGTYMSGANTMVVANDDFRTIEVNETVMLDPVSNDVIPNGVVDSFRVVRPPFNGTVSGTTGGTDIEYTPQMDFCGKDSMDYVVCSDGMCDRAKILITVNCPPVYTPRNITEVRVLDSTGVSVLDGQDVTLEGVVHSLNFRGGGLQFLILDVNNKGIMVFSNSDDLGYTVLEGDEVAIEGTVGQFRGATQINADAVRVGSSGNTLFEATGVNELNEDTENQLVTLSGLRPIDPSQWTNSGFGFNVDMTDGIDTFLVRIDDDSELYDAAAPFNQPDIVYNVTGVGSQFKFDAPYNSGYQLLPRYTTDLEQLFVDNTNEPYWAGEIKMSPNPAYDFLNVKGLRNIDRFKIFNTVGKQILTCEDPAYNHSVPVSQLDAGFYIIIFEKAGEQSHMTFVKS